MTKVLQHRRCAHADERFIIEDEHFEGIGFVCIRATFGAISGDRSSGNFGETCASGSQSQTVVPAPSLLSMLNAPFDCCARPGTMDSLRPVSLPIPTW